MREHRENVSVLPCSPPSKRDDADLEKIQQDGSIVPTQVSSHVMSIFYGMAEKVAESVLKDWEGKQNRSSVRQKRKKC